MTQITYKDKMSANHDVISSTVYLDKRSVGIIKKAASGWQYFPKGHEGGEVYPTIIQVRNSLESGEQVESQS